MLPVRPVASTLGVTQATIDWIVRQVCGSPVATALHCVQAAMEPFMVRRMALGLANA